MRIYKASVLWVLKCLLNLGNFKPSSNIRFLYFDNSYNNSSQKNICNIFIYIYIITIWRKRKENLRIGNLKRLIIRKLVEYRKFVNLISSQKFEKLSDELAPLDIENLIDLSIDQFTICFRQNIYIFFKCFYF